MFSSKYQNILRLEEFVARNITTNSEKYTSFLTTAANNFKYSFEEQLLIYAQKPNATAFLTEARQAFLLKTCSSKISDILLNSPTKTSF